MIIGIKRPPQKVKASVAVKVKRGYAPPEQYAHLDVLPDHIKEELDVLFCGINPGVKSAKLGHHFSNPRNHFWYCLHNSNLTNAKEQLSPTEDHTLPDRFNLGLTNIVERPSTEAGELSKNEIIAGVPGLLRKISHYRPRIVCFVGKLVWVPFERTIRSSIIEANSPDQSTGNRSNGKRKRAAVKAPFTFDIQSYKVVHPTTAVDSVRETLFFVLPSTSGLVAGYQRDAKVEFCKVLKQRLESLVRGELDTTSMAIIPVQSS